ncbi:MAG: hypothetical protein QOF96_3228 [Actinomycetota bacterium]|nr:hypothetical protein [Actinomycetota bacterium]
MGRHRRSRAGRGITAAVAVLTALMLPAPPASAESPIHPENRPSGLAGETNGQVRPEALVGVESDCQAARAAGPSLALMMAAARTDGVALRPGGCYRPANQQSAAKSNACGKGNCACAAGTGTSMHGWGEAVDFRDAGGSLTFTASGYRWLKDNGARFGWNHARWSEPGGSACPEAWHWEWVGDGGRMHLDTIRADVVGILACRAGGYWGLTGLGGVAARGGAPDAGSAAAAPLAWLVKGGAGTPSGRGYWLVASDGGIFSFGDAAFFGSLGSVRLNRPIVGMAPTPSGRGYWLVASDGGIFSFGDAAFFGSRGGSGTGDRFVAMAATQSGRGYWLAAADGGVFPFGDAAPAGGLTAKPNLPIVGMAGSQSGKGYWLAAADGSVFPFGDAVVAGSA